MSKALATRNKTVEAPYPFTVNDTFISIVIGDQPFNLSEAHPTFTELRNALLAKKWKKVPHLVTVAAKIANKSHGAVTVNKGGVYYKGRKIDSSLTKRIQQLIKESHPVDFMLKFMSNLYANPNESAILELYDFLNAGEFPITDDGCFIAYKVLRRDFTDCHTGKFNNSPGQIVVMKRSDVNTDRHQTCSSGLHFCSLGYLKSFSGDKIVAVKINPKDVVSIPSDYSYTKGRTWKYEVIKELADYSDRTANEQHPYMTATVVMIAKERRDLLTNILSNKTVKRAIYRGKVKEASLRKWSYAQLAKFWQKLPVAAGVSEQSKLFDNTLKVIREQNNISLKEIADELDLSYKAVWAAERASALRQVTIDRYLDGIAAIVAQRKGGNRSAAA